MNYSTLWTISFVALLFWVIVFGYKLLIEFLRRREKKEISERPISMPAIEGFWGKADKKWDDRLWIVNAIEKSLISSGLPIIAVIISLFTLISSERANKLTELESLPRFEVRKEFNGMDRGFITPSSSESLIFENKGGLCYSLRDQTISFFEVSITENAKTKIFLVPLDGYLSWSKYDDCKAIILSNNDGEHRDDSNYAMVMNMFRGLNQDLNRIIFSRPVNFTKLTYQDTFGNLGAEYYAFLVVPDVKKINNPVEFDDMLRIYNTRKHFGLDANGVEILEYISTLSPDYEYLQEQ